MRVAALRRPTIGRVKAVVDHRAPGWSAGCGAASGARVAGITR
jgi:hypothetical protein